MKLRELKEKDVDGMLEWMHSSKTKEIFAKDFNSLTREQVLNFIKNSSKNDNELHYACVDDNDNYLGTISLKNIDNNNKNAELAISFREEAQGTGAASFAINELLKRAFNDLNLNKVYLCVLETNKRAIAFYNKIGFKIEKVSTNYITKNDRCINLVWYQILADDFLNI